MEIKIPNVLSFLDSSKEDGEDASLSVIANDVCVFEVETTKKKSKASIILSKQQLILLGDTIQLILKNDLINDQEED